ncbi:MAG: alpha-mannosidase, partial [Roseburia sp.]|nr:alpha-mannosidase [Roseburia sp.]
MNNITAKFIQLKTSVGGNREKNAFEFTFGKTMEEKANITRPNPANTRILAELEFVMHLSEANEGAYDTLLEKALDYLLDCMKQQGVLTNQACEAAEDILMPVSQAAKEYKVILAAHAHIDMNWMWSYNETVAVTLATFRSVLNIMDQYPDFCFSQSQASVYKIVEEYDPAMMEEIKARIAEGRWEVTATAWVETDKNMPSGESLLRHIEYTREYLTKVWGVKRLEVDFSPDTFGHSANVPEINTYGGVKYYYHCRGIDTKQVLYRYKAPSGKEVLVHREHNWYNSAITPHIGTQVTEISKRSGGLKTSLIVYGVGDHGGGPTRRDVERALEMMTWKIFPEIRFGTLHEYFDEAQKVWEKLPVVAQEMNFIFPGCYTTQSRIKRGNRRLEAALLDAEAMSTIAGKFAEFPYAKKQMTSAWQNVLFTHFHDILPGSCVQDSREYAMGLYQTSMAVANTQTQNAMRSIALKIDTSSIPVDIDAYNSQSEGAGAGYGVENFIGVPSTERGSGRTRIFHVFNTTAFDRKENVELTVWDWTGDLKRVQMKDFHGNPIPFQLLDAQNAQYWDHQYFRVLAEVKVPALGYTTVVLSEEEPEAYPIYLYTYKWDRIGSAYDDFILENDLVRACIDRKTGRLISLMDKKTGAEMIAGGIGAGFTYVETENKGMTAWTIGRHLLDIPVERC